MAGWGGHSPAQIGMKESYSQRERARLPGLHCGRWKALGVTTGVFRETGRLWSEGAQCGGGGGRLEHRGWVRCEEGILLGQECSRSSPEAGPSDSGDRLVGQQGLLEHERQDAGFLAVPCTAGEGGGDDGEGDGCNSMGGGLPPISKSLSVTMYSGWGEIKNGWVVRGRMVETLGGSN